MNRTASASGSLIRIRIGDGLRERLRTAHGLDDQVRVLRHKESGPGEFDDLAKLIEDQSRLEFQGGSQSPGDLQQHGLLAGVGFQPLVKQLFRLNPPVDIPDDAQQAGLILIGEGRPARLGVER